MRQNAGVMQDYDTVYVSVRMFSDEDRKLVEDKILEAAASGRARLEASGERMPQVVVIHDASELHVRGKTGLIVLSGREGAGLVDAISSVNSDHAYLTAYRITDDGKQQVASQNVELPDGLLDGFSKKADTLRGTVLTYLYKPSGGFLFN